MGAEAKVTFQADVPLTDAQTAKLQTLRGRVEGIQKDLHPLDKDYWGSDHALKRVLVARQWNVDAAEKMYKQIVAFRAERQCWKYLNEPGFYREPEVLRLVGSLILGWLLGSGSDIDLPVSTPSR